MKYILLLLLAFPLYAQESTDTSDTQAPLLGIPVVTQSVLLQVLDKITGRMSTLHAKKGEITTFGKLNILVKHCQKSPPEDPPESKAFLEIWDEKDGQKTILFSNWMFSSSPSLSTLEHPVYGVWVKECVEEIKP